MRHCFVNTQLNEIDEFDSIRDRQNFVLFADAGAELCVSGHAHTGCVTRVQTSAKRDESCGNRVGGGGGGVSDGPTCRANVDASRHPVQHVTSRNDTLRHVASRCVTSRRVASRRVASRASSHHPMRYFSEQLKI